MTKYNVVKMNPEMQRVLIGVHEGETFSVHEDGSMQIDAEGMCVAYYAPFTFDMIERVVEVTHDVLASSDFDKMIQDKLDEAELNSNLPDPDQIPMWP